MPALDDRPAPPSAGNRPPLAVLVPVAVAVACLTILFVCWTAWLLTRAMPPDGGWHWLLGAVSVLSVLGSLTLLVPAGNSLSNRRKMIKSRTTGDRVSFRKYQSRAHSSAAVTLGSCLAVISVGTVVLFLLANNQAVQQTFFDPAMISRSWLDVTKAFGTNVIMAVGSEFIVLIWALVLALAKLAPGRAGRPISLLATAYIDSFRAVPAIIVIYLVGFGLPLAGFPVLSAMSPTWAAIFALSLVYGAYVAEVFRAGIDSIHSSQMAAARSLGLSYASAMRHVIIPQAVRRVIPPLLNDFIGLQKDTALVMVIGTIEAFNQAKIFSSNYFNLSSVTVVAVLFIIVTIPQTRFVDRLIARDQQRLRSNG